MRMHVKGRVLESALAGCLLLESAGAPTKEWFQPGIHYLEYTDAYQAEKIIRSMEHEPERSQSIADNLQSIVKAHHTHEAFWSRVLDRLSLELPRAA